MNNLASKHNAYLLKNIMLIIAYNYWGEDYPSLFRAVLRYSEQYFVIPSSTSLFSVSLNRSSTVVRSVFKVVWWCPVVFVWHSFNSSVLDILLPNLRRHMPAAVVQYFS